MIGPSHFHGFKHMIVASLEMVILSRWNSNVREDTRSSSIKEVVAVIMNQAMLGHRKVQILFKLMLPHIDHFYCHGRWMRVGGRFTGESPTYYPVSLRSFSNGRQVSLVQK